MIPDLEDGVAYTSFLNGLKSGQFKFSLVEQKETTLVEALRKAVNFIHATEICTASTDVPKKAKVPRNRSPSQRTDEGGGDRGPQLEVVNPQFTTDPRSILMKVRDHPMLKRLPPMTSMPKPHNAWKYCEFYE